MSPWLVVATFGWLIGDLLGLREIGPYWQLAGAAGGAVCFLAARRAVAPRLMRVGVALLACVAGYSNAARVYRPAWPSGHIASEALPATLSLEARVVTDAEQRFGQTRLLLEMAGIRRAGDWQPASGLVWLTLREAGQPWAAGDRLTATLSLRRPRNFGNPDEFDYEAYLARQGVYVVGFALDDRRFGRDPAPRSWTQWMSRWRRMSREVYRRALPMPEAQLLDALVLGSQRELPAELQDAFRRTGTSHILAISGLNVGLVAAAGYGVFRWLLGRRERVLLLFNVPRLASFASLLPVFLYAGIAGTNLSTIRALVMAALLLGAVMVERRHRTDIGLATAALWILWSWPGSAADPSFQLSFAAVAGLGLGMNRFHEWWQAKSRERLIALRGRRGRIEQALMLYLVVSATAMLSTVPLVAFHFNQLSIIAPLANAIAVPLLGSVAVGLGLLAAMAAPLSSTLAVVCAATAWPALAAGRAVVSWLAAVPHAAMRLPSLTGIELLLVYALIGCWFVSSRRRFLAATLLLAMFGDVCWWWNQRFHRDVLAMTFLSVGQGDCAVVELPGGEVMVVDGGGMSSQTFDVGERIIAPFLWSRKITRIDYLVLSHPQWDHYGGLLYLSREFAPRQFWWTGRRTEAVSFRRLPRDLHEGGNASVELRAGDRRELGTVAAEILAPTTVEGVSLNDGSLVVALEYAGRRALFTGDIEEGAERRLLRGEASLRASILKVPHHGSATSSSVDFIAAVQPQVAVASLGFANRFSFPHRRTVGRYAASGARFLRTDRDGAIRVEIDGSGRISLHTERRREGTEPLFDSVWGRS